MNYEIEVCRTLSLKPGDLVRHWRAEHGRTTGAPLLNVGRRELDRAATHQSEDGSVFNPATDSGAARPEVQDYLSAVNDIAANVNAVARGLLTSNSDVGDLKTGLESVSGAIDALLASMADDDAD